MGMTIDEAIDFLVESKYSYESPSSDTLDVAISTMHKYQKIEQIYSDFVKYMNAENLADRIGEVVEYGNDD